MRVEDELDGAPRRSRGGWHDLKVEDGTMRLNLSQVVYVRTERDEHRVGFGLSSLSLRPAARSRAERRPG